MNNPITTLQKTVRFELDPQAVTATTTAALPNNKKRKVISENDTQRESPDVVHNNNNNNNSNDDNPPTQDQSSQSSSSSSSHSSHSDSEPEDAPMQGVREEERADEKQAAFSMETLLSRPILPRNLYKTDAKKLFKIEIAEAVIEIDKAQQQAAKQARLANKLAEMQERKQPIKITLPTLSLPEGSAEDLHTQYKRLCDAFRKRYTNLTLQGRKAAARQAEERAIRVKNTHLTSLARLIQEVPLSGSAKDSLFDEARSEIHHLSQMQQVRRTIANQRKAKKERERQVKLENKKHAALSSGGAEVTRAFIQRTVASELQKQNNKKQTANKKTANKKNAHTPNTQNAPNASSGRGTRSRSHHSRKNNHNNNNNRTNNRNNNKNNNRNNNNKGKKKKKKHRNHSQK